jgi:cystathionine beta-lyase family protein involved in aluminum resistance
MRRVSGTHAIGTALWQILQLGGEVFISGCTFLTLSPYSIRAPVFWGGDVSIRW